LEDLSMKYTEAEVYKMIAKKLNETKRERSRYINEFIKPLKARLQDSDLKFDIVGRPKSIHSIWSKMKKKGVEFEEVYDLFAVRIIIDVLPEKEKSECWRVYSLVTDTYRPNPGRLRDWVSTPKANGYEALHITVMGPKGKWVEVQIRTERMDEIAEKGYAAHWKYKEDSADNMLDDWLTRIRELLQNPESSALDFVNDFKLNLFSDEIYVFTPKGQLRILPKGATSLDFAFDIHTDIGAKCIGAKVNHKLVPLSYKLRNGDQVEIITSRKQKPTEDWLNLVVTGKAKAKIKSSLKDEKRAIAEDGKEILKRKLKGLKAPWSETLVHEITSFYSYKTSLDLFYNIAQQKVDLSKLNNVKIVKDQIIDQKKNDEIVLEEKEESVEDSIRNKLQKNAELLIFDESADNIDHKFAPCCNPIPGDDVFGFITVNEGIKIHKTSCPNAVQLMSNYGYRIVKTKWTKQHGIAFLTEVKVSGLDDVGIMNKITTIISGELKLNMQSLSIDGKDGIFEGLIKVYVNNTEELDQLINKLKSVDGILSVNRL
ncbi:MAG: TGS domain-containing protein, partial [Chitinophagales bacterium]